MMTWLSFTSFPQEILQTVFDPFFGRVVEPVEPENVLPPLEKQKRRNAHDLEPGAKALVVPGVDLDDLDVREFFGCPRKDRNEGFAGGARRGEKIHDHGNPRLHHLFLEIPLADFDEILSRTHPEPPPPVVGVMKKRSALRWASGARQALSSTGSAAVLSLPPAEAWGFPADGVWRRPERSGWRPRSGIW